MGLSLFIENYQKVFQYFWNFNATHIWNIDEMGLTTLYAPNPVVNHQSQSIYCFNGVGASLYLIFA